MLNKFVIVRTYSAGVHIGTLEKQEGKEVVLKNARRIWFWKGAFTLNAVAKFGVKEGSKLSEPVDTILLTEAIEIIPVTAEAEKILVEFPVHQ